MKKLIKLWVVFLLLNSVVFWANNSLKIDSWYLEWAKKKIESLYNKNPEQAYKVQKNISSFYSRYKNNASWIFLLQYIEAVTNNYIKDYEKYLEAQKEADKKKEEETILQTIDEKINKQNSELKVLDDKDVKKIATFDIEPKYDNLLLKNVFFENIWTVQDITSLFQKLYLVDNNNKIIAEWYVQNNFIKFDINWDYILKDWTIKVLNIMANIRQPNSDKQIWELKFELKSPSNAPVGTLNWLRAISYSNGSYMTINVKSTLDPIKTLVSYNELMFESDNDYSISYSQAMGFAIYNNSNKRMEINSFEFSISWSFLSWLNDSSKVIVREKWTNQIIWSETLFALAWSRLNVNVSSGTPAKSISPNTKMEFVVEIEHIGNVEWRREIQMNNIVIADWEGWQITNLNQYTGTWLPSSYIDYRY